MTTPQPLTAAGQRLLDQMPYWRNSAHHVSEEVIAAILAIEAEARATPPELPPIERARREVREMIAEGDAQADDGLMGPDGLADGLYEIARGWTRAARHAPPDAVLRYRSHVFANVNPEAQCPDCGFPAWTHDPAQAFLYRHPITPLDAVLVTRETLAKALHALDCIPEQCDKDQSNGWGRRCDQQSLALLAALRAAPGEREKGS